MAGAVDIQPELCKMPEPLLGEPPERCCDIVLTGGVASGVVYPWAIVEIARAFKLRSIGGTSVGAMAAALAAACEYGRRHGHPHHYEVMRRLPAALAEGVRDPVDGVMRTRMLTLFQPGIAGRRVFRLLLEALDLLYGNPGSGAGIPPGPTQAGTHPDVGDRRMLKEEPERAGRFSRFIRLLANAYGIKGLLRLSWVSLVLGAVGLLCYSLLEGAALLMPDVMRQMQAVALKLRLSLLLSWTYHIGFSIAGLAFVVAACQLLRGVVGDLREGVLRHHLGLCKGASVPGDGGSLPALVEWLDEGIQRAAGLALDAPPLTFEDLWHAPLRRGGPRPAMGAGGLPVERSINLEMVTTNVMHGRPYRLPLGDPDSRLFFRRKDWQGFLSKRVLDALCDASEPYRPKSRSDPIHGRIVVPDTDNEGSDDLLELPGARMPIVVAARLSLSYPLLFSAPPLYAVDREPRQREERRLRLCRFSDGGLCSNFPVHFFDSALPRWPTFGIWLDRRSRDRPDAPVWLPEHDGKGRGDKWQHFEPAGAPSSPPRGMRAICRRGVDKGGPCFRTLTGFLSACFATAKNWRDHTSMRMPHVRRRVVRVGLLPGEGELNIGMPASKIMRMADVYGTAAGLELRTAYAPAGGEGTTRAWREHLWTRLDVLLAGLNDLFRRFGEAVNSGGHTIELRRLLRQAAETPPLERLNDGRLLRSDQVEALLVLVDALESLEKSLRTRPATPHASRPAPELRLRPPL